MDALEALKQAFEKDSFRHCGKDKAFVWVGYSSEDWNDCGRFRSIHRNWLCGREYTVRLSATYPQGIHIHMLDSTYDRKTRTHTMSIDPHEK